MFSSNTSGPVNLVCELLGHRVVVPRFARIDEGDHPGDHELRQSKEITDVDDTPHLDLEQIREVRGADRQSEVIDHRECHQAPQKRALSAVKLLESWIGFDSRPIERGGYNGHNRFPSDGLCTRGTFDPYSAGPSICL